MKFDVLVSIFLHHWHEFHIVSPLLIRINSVDVTNFQALFQGVQISYAGYVRSYDVYLPRTMHRQGWKLDFWRLSQFVPYNVSFSGLGYLVRVVALQSISSISDNDSTALLNISRYYRTQFGLLSIHPYPIHTSQLRHAKNSKRHSGWRGTTAQRECTG